MITLVALGAVVIAVGLDRYDKHLDRRESNRSSHFLAPGDDGRTFR